MEYDQHKNEINIRKHHISIPELYTAFENKFMPIRKDIPDPGEYDEDRYWAFGWTTTGWYVKIWYTYRDGEIRIIGGMKIK